MPEIKSTRNHEFFGSAYLLTKAYKEIIEKRSNDDGNSLYKILGLIWLSVDQKTDDNFSMAGGVISKPSRQ